MDPSEKKMDFNTNKAVLKPKKESIQENFRVYGGILQSNLLPASKKCKKHPHKQGEVTVVDFASRYSYEPVINNSHVL
jgi:hypothetical protein